MSLCDRVNLGKLPGSHQLEDSAVSTIVLSNRTPSGEKVSDVSNSTLQANSDRLTHIHNVLKDKSIKKRDLLNFSKNHLEEFDEEAVTALWYKLSLKERELDMTFQDPDLEIVINHTKNMLNSFKIKQISVIAASFANLGCEDQRHFQMFRDKVSYAVASGSELDRKDLINILKAFASVCYEDKEFIQSITRLLDNKLQDPKSCFDKYDLLDMTVAFCSIGLNFHRNSSILDKLKIIVLVGLNTHEFFDRDDIILILWYFAKMGIVSNGFKNAINQNLKKMLKQPEVFSNQQIAKITWAISRYPNISLEVRLLLEKDIVRRLEQHVDDAFNGRDLYCILNGFCRLKSENYLLFNLLGREVLGKLHIQDFFCPQSLAYIFYNFTGLIDIDFTIMDRLIPHIIAKLEDPEFFNSCEIALVVSALSHVNYRYSAYVNPIMHMIKEKLLIDNFFDEQQLASIAYSCVGLNYKNEEFWNVLKDVIETKTREEGSFNQAELVDITWSLVMLDKAVDVPHLIHNMLMEIQSCYDDLKISDACLIKHLQIRSALKTKALPIENPWTLAFNKLLDNFEVQWKAKLSDVSKHMDIFTSLKELFKINYPDSVFKIGIYESCHFVGASVELHGLKIGIEISNVRNDRNLQQRFMQKILSKYEVLRNLGWSYIIIERSTWNRLDSDEMYQYISEKLNELMSVEDPLIRDFKELSLFDRLIANDVQNRSDYNTQPDKVVDFQLQQQDDEFPLGEAHDDQLDGDFELQDEQKLQ